MKSKKRAVLAFAAVICAMHIYNSIRVKHNLLKCALVRPSVSPWAKLLSCGDESSFLMLTGFNYTSFRLLVSSIFTDDERFGPRGKGRPHALDFNARMGLCLFFLGSRMRLKHLLMLFGVTPPQQVTRSMWCRQSKWRDQLIFCYLSPMASYILPY